MSNDQPISRELFIKRLVNLCLRSGLSGFPNDNGNLHILLKSAALTLDKSAEYTEKEINEKLAYWIDYISQIKEIDHVTLRRMLIDAGYLTRNNDGSCYRVSQTEPLPHFFDQAVDQIEIMEVITTAREEIARRKIEHMEKIRMQAKDK